MTAGTRNYFNQKLSDFLGQLQKLRHSQLLDVLRRIYRIEYSVSQFFFAVHRLILSFRHYFRNLAQGLGLLPKAGQTFQSLVHRFFCQLVSGLQTV